jgi:N-acylglucosamine-6-phosphate 2-epimerase
MFDPGIIVSCQMPNGGPFELDAYRFAIAAEKGGAVALRIQGLNNLIYVKQHVKIPVIGLLKDHATGCARITPHLEDAIELDRCGADYIAADATYRWGFDIENMVDRGLKVIGDVATLDQAKRAEEIGCVAITTALSGYIPGSEEKEFGKPDILLVRDIAEAVKIPVIAEGRYFDAWHIMNAKRCGAYGVCIGAAVTLPEKITRRYVEVFDWQSI